MATESKEQLLTDWDNRPSAFWGDDAAKRVSNDIRLLEALQKGGCDKTRDGLSVAMQLDECRIVLRDIMRAQGGA
jgi:hypothetical protein